MTNKSLSISTPFVLVLSLICILSSVSFAGWTVLTDDDFEGGWGSYSDGGTNCERYSGGTNAVGTYAAKIEWNKGTDSSFAHTNSINVHSPGYTQIKVDFWFRMTTVENGERLWVQYYDGSTWQTVGTYIYGSPYVDDTSYPNNIVIIDEGSYNFPTNMKIRFMCEGSGDSDDFYIDEIVVSGLNAVAQVTVPNVVTLPQATAEANITSANLIVGSITNSFSNTVSFGDVISQTPSAGTSVGINSQVNLNVSKGKAGTDFDDLLVFVAEWLTTGCGTCNDQDYFDDDKVDLKDYTVFAEKWLNTPIPELIINEFMASNDTTIVDPDEAGDYPDWIEIYNYGTESVTMDGMKLVDDTSANMYTIPAGVTIAAGEYLLFWADGSLDEGQGAMHVGFKLGASGDEIYLYDTDGISLLDSIVYRTDQTTDISHGRFPDNTAAWYNMDDPTPGETNTAGMAGDVHFSKVSGIFASSFTLELFSETPNAIIRYTTNGNAPTDTSTIYSSGISIGTGGPSRIRAQAYHATFAPSNVQSHYYTPLASNVQDFKSNLPILILDTYGSNVSEGTWATWPGSGLLTFVSSTFIDVDKDTGIASMTDVPDYAGRSGMKTRGESSTEYPKKQFRLELWDENDIDENHSLLGMASESDWILNAPYGDKTLMRNVLAYKWGNDMMSGFAAPETRFVEVFLNDDNNSCSYGDYNGIYVLIEKLKISKNRLDIGKLKPEDSTGPEVTGGYMLRVDKNFENTEFEFFNTSDNRIGNIQYYDPDEFDLTGTQKTWIRNHLNDFEDVLDPINTSLTTGYPSYIDVENFQETDVILELFKNIDGFKLSTYFYKEKNGPISFGPMWDYNFSAGNATNDGWNFLPRYSMATNTTNSEDWWNDDFGVYGWHSRLMNDLEYKLGTADKWFEHREDKLSDAQIVTDIDNNYTYLKTDVAFSGGANNAADRNFNRWNILNSWVSCNYYFGNNGGEAEQGDIPHTYHMEKEWLKNWFTGQGTSAPGESYIANYTDRAGIVDAFWGSNRDMVAPPTLRIGGIAVDAGGTITSSVTLTMTKSTSGTIYYTTNGTDPRAVGGGIAGTSYGGGITLNNTTQINARIKDGSNWSALNEAVFSDSRVANSLRITEIMYNPTDPNDEFIEFKNIGGATIDLALCEVTKGVDFTFPSMTLAPGAYTIITRNQAHFEATYLAENLVSYSGSIAGEFLVDKLNNSGEKIRLKDAAGIIIQEFDYEDGWFPITDGYGFSLNIIDHDLATDTWNKRLSWQASNVIGGSPGAAPTANVAVNDAIVINEILTHTDDLVDGDWVELYNTTGSSIDISGWYLSDKKDNLKRYVIPPGTSVPAGATPYLVLTSVSDFPFGLSEHGEEVFLTSGDGIDILGGYSIGESFGSSKSDVTFGRHTKGAPTYNTDFIELSGMTQGADNDPPHVPDVVITEIMYNAQDIEDQLGEYIELHNRDTGAVNLSNSGIPWKFTKGIDFTFPIGTSIAGGEMILISRAHPEAFKVANAALLAANPGVTVYGPFASGTELENDGEKIELSMPTDPDPGTGFISYIRVEQVNYSDGIHPLGSDPWPTSADARGDSLHRITLSDYSNDVANWQAATPTPGI